MGSTVSFRVIVACATNTELRQKEIVAGAIKSRKENAALSHLNAGPHVSLYRAYMYLF